MVYGKCVVWKVGFFGSWMLITNTVNCIEEQCRALRPSGSAVWRCVRNGCNLPVLKHGPRSLTYVQVFECKTRARNESKCLFGKLRWESFIWGGTIDRSWSSVKDLSLSIYVGTRKMVNYAWIGWSQRKLWWKLAAVLTCKSIVKFGYRGERLIEPSSSWFPPKFPSG